MWRGISYGNIADITNTIAEPASAYVYSKYEVRIPLGPRRRFGTDIYVGRPFFLTDPVLVGLKFVGDLERLGHGEASGLRVESRAKMVMARARSFGVETVISKNNE